MNVFTRIVGNLVLLGVAGFCAFGFLATFEPHDGSWLHWRVLYATVGLASLFLLTRNIHRSLSRP